MAGGVADLTDKTEKGQDSLESCTLLGHMELWDGDLNKGKGEIHSLSLPWGTIWMTMLQ